MAIGRIPEPGTGIPESIIAAKGDILTGTANDTPAVLTAGTNETRLVADSGEATGLKYVADTTNYAVAAKGDLLVGTAADTVAPLTVGTDGYTLVADSVEATGLKWVAPASASALILLNTTSFSAVTSQSINDVFSTTYDNYLILINSIADQTRDLLFRLRVSGADASGSDYNYHRDASFSGGALNATTSNSTRWEVSLIDDLAQQSTVLTVVNPFTALKTAFTTVGGRSTLQSTATGYHNLATSYTGFTFFPNAGTNNMTGSVSVYGYSK